METILIFAGICVPFILLTAWAVVDAALKDFCTVARKAVWVIVAAIPFVGCVIYFLFGRRQGKKAA